VVPPYGADITDPIPYPLSNPQSANQYTATNEAYDIAINGQPFFLMTSDDTPYRRVTAQYRKQQYDQTREAGEQSLTGWWFRSQSSFHLGQGIKYFEPAQDESLRFQYTESKGLNVWTKGQATLINDVDQGHNTTSPINANGRPDQHLRSIKWTKSGNTYDGCLLLDGFDINKIYPTITASVTNKALTSNVATLTANAHGFAVGMTVEVSGVDATFNGSYTITAVTANTFSYAKTAADVASAQVSPAGTAFSNDTHFQDYATVGAYKVYGLCDDGVYAYWLALIDDSGTDKTALYKKLLNDDATVSPTEMFKTTAILVNNAVLEFTKERIVACINNKVFEISTTATALPTAVYTHPVDNFVYTSVTSSGAAIYCTGYSGSQSNIQKFTLASNGTMPTLTSAITAAEMPSGELIQKIYYYLGYMMIGTSKGVRVAAVSDDGSLAYGPLLFESEQPVYDFAARDRFVWAATNVDGAPGTTRIDLGTQIGTLIFPYAWDTYYYPETAGSRVTGRRTTACAFINGTNRLAFTTNYDTTNGYVYVETDEDNNGRLVYEGYLQTGYVRYNTLENKIFKLLQARFDTTNGGLALRSIDSVGSEYAIGTFAQGQDVPEVTISYPALPQEYLGFKFTLTRSSTDNTKGPLFTGYQLKSLPSVPRQRLIQYPLACFDRESDKFGVEVGYEGRAFDRMETLESIESNGDTLRVDDFRTGESYIGIIEELDFINRTPTDKRFSGFGGLLIATIRSV
jgi:hypothetical protein